MDYYLVIKPSFDCYLEVDNSTIHLSQNRLNPCLISTDDQVLSLSFFASDNTSSLPFTLSIRLHECVLSIPHHNAELITFDSKTLLLLLNPFLEFSPSPLSVKTKQVYFGGSSHTITYLTHDFFCVRLESTSAYIDKNYNRKVVNLHTKTLNNILFVYSKTTLDTYVVMVAEFQNDKYFVLTLEEVDVLELENNKILTFSALNDIAKHGITKEYSFDKEFKMSSSLVFVYDDLKRVTKKELIPYAFFDGVRSENYALAREYLAPILKDKLKDEHIKTFFGDFFMYHQSLNPRAPKNQIALIYDAPPRKFAKEFLVTQEEDGLITNITEI